MYHDIVFFNTFASMKHVLGITVPELLLSPEKLHDMKTTMRLLRRTTQELERGSDQSVVYMVTMNHEISEMLHNFAVAEQINDFVELYFLTPDYSDYMAAMKVIPLKPHNFGSMFAISEEEFSQIPPEKINRFCKIVGKRCLRRETSRLEQGVTEVTDMYELPAGIDWDFYGFIED